MRTICVANHKGGVGKTTTARALGAELASTHGQRVLLVDLDAQFSLTRACGIRDAPSVTAADVLGGSAPGVTPMGDVLLEVGPGLWLAPGGRALASTEMGLVTRMGRENQLRQALATVGDRFDVGIVDTAPALGLLTVNALTAADGVLIPTLPELLALHGLVQFMDTIDEVRRQLNARLKIVGVLVTFYNGRTVHHTDGLAAIRGAGYPVFAVQIGRSVRVPESSIQGQAVTEYAPSNPRAREYRELAAEVLTWLKRA